MLRISHFWKLLHQLSVHSAQQFSFSEIMVPVGPCFFFFVCLFCVLFFFSVVVVFGCQILGLYIILQEKMRYACTHTYVYDTNSGRKCNKMLQEKYTSYLHVRMCLFMHTFFKQYFLPSYYPFLKGSPISATPPLSYSSYTKDFDI